MSIIDSAYVESACGEKQAKSVARSLLQERDAALLQVGELQKVVDLCKDTLAQFCGDSAPVIAHPPKCRFYIQAREKDCNCTAKNTANDILLSLRACREILAKRAGEKRQCGCGCHGSLSMTVDYPCKTCKCERA